MKKTIAVLLLCLAIVVVGGIASKAAASPSGASAVQAKTAGITFPDVEPGSLYYDGIMYLAERGIVGGYGSGLFGPYDTLSRAQLAKMIVEIKGFHTPSLPTGVSTFPDVPNDGTTFPFDYVEEAAANAEVLGYTGGNFGPYDSVTRIQLTRIVVRAYPNLAEPPAGYTSGFGDVAAEDEPFVARAKFNGLIEGKTATTFEPSGLANRGQTAKVLCAAHTVAGGEERPMRLGYDRDFAPFAWDDNGVARGWSIEVVQAACDRRQLEIVFIPKDMAGQAEMFARGQLDAVIDEPVIPPGVLYDYEYSQHYVLTGAAFLRLAGVPPVSLATIDGLRVATPATGPVYSFLQTNHPGVTLVAVPGYPQAYQAVLDGQADAPGLNADVGYDLAEQLFPGQFGKPGPMFMKVGLSVARPKDMGRGFLDVFDAGLASIRSDGTLAVILGER